MTPAGPRTRVDSWPRLLFAVIVGSLALVVSAWFFPPRFDVWSRRNPRLQEWYRADAFFRQSEQPLRQDVEPAVRWRLLPPIVCHALGLTGYKAQAFCWAGLAAFAACLAARLDQLTRSRAWVIVGTLGFATSGPFITALRWLGLNDGWYLLALLESAAGRSLWTLAAWTFLGPWIDERFLIALPLALYVRWRLRAPEPGLGVRTGLVACAGVAPYLLIRAGFSLTRGDAASSDYLHAMLDVFRLYASYVPLGWAMGYRAAWLAVAAGLLAGGIAWRSRLLGSGLAAASLVTIALVAWDLDRSTSVLLPAYVLGIVVAAQADAASGRGRRSGFFLLGAACLMVNLAIPYAHVVGFTVTWNRGPFGIWRALAGG